MFRYGIDRHEVGQHGLGERLFLIQPLLGADAAVKCGQTSFPAMDRPGQLLREKGNNDRKQQHCAAEDDPTCKDVNCACIVLNMGLRQGHTDFSKMLRPPQNSTRQKDDMNQFAH